MPRMLDHVDLQRSQEYDNRRELCQVCLCKFVSSSGNADKKQCRYEQACIRATLAADPDFRYCLSTTCKSGQLHPGGTDEPIFRCEHCGHKHCIVCEANWHQDQTCEEFQAVRRRLHAENERSQQEVKKLSKPCPGCRVPIQKNRGCDHMRCQYRSMLSALLNADIHPRL